jgi:hypothetical protein
MVSYNLGYVVIVGEDKYGETDGEIVTEVMVRGKITPHYVREIVRYCL